MDRYLYPELTPCNPAMSEQPKVIIRCLVYNHEPYLRDCLEGFVMQQTNFPFKAVVHDDCSTDNSAAIIREYAEKYPHIIEPIYEPENQYSKRDGSLRRVMDAATLNRSPYLAFCEGDDYWIDPCKLQKQVDYLDEYKECSMTCTNAEVEIPHLCKLTAHQLNEMHWPKPLQEGYLKLEDIILKGGSYIHTCSILCRSNIIEELHKNLPILPFGDYPIQIFSRLKGKVYFFNSKMCVYRYCCKNSWTYKMLGEPAKLETLKTVLSIQIEPTYIQQAQNALLALRLFPKYRKVIINASGWVLHYKHLAKYTNYQHNNIFQKIYFIIKRFLIYPYYPSRDAFSQILSRWNPVRFIFIYMYKRTSKKST